ncbi:MAG: flagellar biosynthesis protein FlhF [Candidatus Accumulibacter sp.]|jgi:flagellar biosynthesis protein FlhF|nr:flagellar biosynthesis protein FlhF [Accumulibacter sp.]
MNVKKFVAATARDALSKVKELLGPEAIILSNRTIPEGVEIMAVAPSEMERVFSEKDRTRVETAQSDDYTVKISPPAISALRRSTTPSSALVDMALRNTAAVKTVAQAKPVPVDPPVWAPRPAPEFTPFPKPEGPAEIVPAEVLSEIRSLRKIVEQHLAGMAWGETARLEPAKTEITRHMLEAGFSPKFARDLLVGLPADIDVSRARAWVLERTNRMLATLDPETDIVNRGGVYALVGPTGVGKTTTTAKLAARCVLRHGAGKVTLITTDAYRIGAYEQLRIYGRILGVTVYLAKDVQELEQILNDLRHKHTVLIDTVGMSQKDKRVEEQIAMFGRGVQRLLLLSATSRGDTLEDIVRAYSGPGLAGCILSKIDEAAGLASPLDVIIRSALRLHYVSNGQRVPEDLHLPNRPYLLHRAFKDVPELSPQRLEGMETGLMMAGAGFARAAGAQHA